VDGLVYVNLPLSEGSASSAPLVHANKADGD